MPTHLGRLVVALRATPGSIASLGMTVRGGMLRGTGLALGCRFVG